MKLSFKKHIKKKTKLFSLEHGLGEIVGVFKLYDGIEDYLEVRFKKDDVVKYYSVKSFSNLRLISSADTLNEALVDLGEKLNCDDFEYEDNEYQRKFEKLDIGFVVNMIAGLSNKNILELKDKTVLRQCLKSLVLEVSHVFKVSENSAKGIVSDYMRCA